MRISRAASWSPLQPVSRGFSVTSYNEGVLTQLSQLAAHEWVGQVLWDTPPLALVSEDVFVGKSHKGSIQLARYAQAVASGCRLVWAPKLVPERRIMERDWRFALGVRGSSPNRIDEIPAIMRSVVSNAVEVAGLIGDTPHFYDAIALAYLGIRFHAWSEDFSDRLPKKPRRKKRGIKAGG